MSDANQIDILRARAIASMPSKQKLQPRPVGKQPEVEREEGELCSSDDDQVSLSSQPTSGRDLPSNNPRLGGYPELSSQEKISAVGMTATSKVLMTEATSSTPNANAIVRKSEFLSGLSATAPFVIPMKSPNEVEITKFSVASQTHVQNPLADADSTRQNGSTVQIAEREPTTSQGLINGSVKSLSAAAPVYRPTPTGSSARHPISFPITNVKNSGRAGGVAKVSRGPAGLSFVAAHRPFSPPFASSHRPLSSFVGARPTSSAARTQSVPHSANRTEADNFLAGLSLSGSNGINSEFIINFDDSDSDGERMQTQRALVQPRSDVNRIGAADDKSIPRTGTPPNGNSELFRPRLGQTTGMPRSKTTMNTRAVSMVRPALVAKSPPPRPDTQIETLRQLIAAKESQLEQSKRVSQLPEPRNTGTQKVERIAGNLLSVNSASKTPFKKKQRISNLAHVDPGLATIQANVAKLSERGKDVDFSGKSFDYQVSTGQSEGTSTKQADVAGLGAKESGTSTSQSTEGVRSIAPTRSAVVIPAGSASEPFPTGTCCVVATATSTEPASYGIKLVESVGRSISGAPVIESGVTKLGNRESLQSAPKMTATGKTPSIQAANLTPLSSPTIPNGNGPASSSGVSGERHLEPIRSVQAKGLSLKRRGFALEDSTELQVGHQLDRISNVVIQPSGRPDLDSACLGNSVSKVANHVAGVSADVVKLLAKRQRTDDHSPQMFSLAEHSVANLPSLSSLPEQRSKAEYCPPPRFSPTDPVEECRGESWIKDSKVVSSKTADLPSMSTLRDSSGLRVHQSSCAHSQLIPNGEKMSEMANATLSRVFEAQETDNHDVTRVDGGGVPCGPLQQLRDLSSINLVTTTEGAGMQILNHDSIEMPPSVINSTDKEQSKVPENFSLRDNHESAPDLGDPRSYDPWPAVQRFDAGGNRMEHFRMQRTGVGGSAVYSSENLREEEDIVDKDLEVAQVHRRDCEFRERELRRAYREAQIALSKANARCEILSQRRKYLSVQVQAAELHSLQQSSFSIHSNSNSLVPFDLFSKITLPTITELPHPAYPSTVGGTAKPSTQNELGLRRISNEQEAHILSSNQVDEQTVKVSSSSVDTEILEENLDRTTHLGTQLSGGHIPNTDDATVGGQNVLSDKDEAPRSGFCAEGEVSVATKSETATSSQKLEIKKDTGTIASSNAAGAGEPCWIISLDMQDSSHEGQDLQNRSMAIRDNDIAVPGSKDGCLTPFTPTSIGQVQAQVAETEVGKEVLDTQETVTSTLKSDRGLLEQEETRTAFGNDRCVQISQGAPGQGPFKASGEVIRVFSSTMQKPSTTVVADKRPSNIPNVLGQDLPSSSALGSVTEEALTNAGEQDVDMVDSEGPKQLRADSRSDGILNNELMTSKHSSGDEGCREQHCDIPAAAGLKISFKNKREISGLRALAENNELQQLDKGLEDTSDCNGQAIRPSSVENLVVEGWAGGSNKSVEQQSRRVTQVQDSEVTGDKGDCASRTSISSKGETSSLKEEEDDKEGTDVTDCTDGTDCIDGTDEVCPKLSGSPNSAENHLDHLADEGELLVGMDRNKTVVLDALSVGLKNAQLPCTSLSIGFANIETGNVPALCLAYNQVMKDKRFDESTFRLASYESPLKMFRCYRMCSAFQTAWHNSVTSQTWSHMLDPCKPLCMFEHRGKCNDEACPWQHMADYTLDNADLLLQLSKYSKPEKEVEAQKLSSEAINVSLGEIINGASENFMSLISKKSLLPRPFTWSRGSPAPAYRIGSYPINQDEGLTSRVKCCLSNQYKFNPFTSLTLSSAVRRPIYSDMPRLPAVFFNVESQSTTADSSGWRYTGERSLAAIEEHVHEEPGDVEAWLELALIRIDFDLNCIDNDAYNEALYVLSRALEANPTVATLWIVYIGLFYHGKGEIGDDDLFFHAIENSKDSYELLLLYINSRTTLSERLKAYELALEALVNVGEQSQEQSSCILDVVIQMLDCMCVAKVTHQLHTWSEDVFNSSSAPASVLTCLIPEDCCTLMLACAYAVAFGQLPENYILRLGCRQELSWDLDWSRRSQVQEGSKDLVLKITEAGMQCASVLSQEVCEQVMAVNYLKCLALYNGSEHALRISRQLLERHSACLELVLFTVHLEREQRWEEVFEQALQNYSKEATGQQRLWYQYAVHMLKAEGRSAAMTVLVKCAIYASDTQWVTSACSDVVDAVKAALQLNTRKFEKPDGSCTFGREAVFAWMNLALYEMLMGTDVDAQFSLEKCLKAAVMWEDVLHCWKEMAAFVRINKRDQEQASAILDLLDRCSVATNASCKLVPLASKLLSPISKRRVRVFLESLIGSASIDHSLMNSVVQVIISKEPRVTKEVAMIVEALMETFPGNYELVLQIFRMLLGNLDSVTDVAAAVWISSLLFGSLLQPSSQAPEQYWVEAGILLERLQDKVSLRNFYQFALVLYPFSASLKKSAALLHDSSLDPNKPGVS